MTVNVLWLLTVLWFGLLCVIVVFPDHTHVFIPIHLFKMLHKSGIGVIMPFLVHRINVMWNIERLLMGRIESNQTNNQTCGILTSSVVAGHVMIAIYRAHSLETNRAGPLSRKISVLSEHIIFTLKGKGT